MEFGYWTSLIRLLLLCKAAQSALIPDGVYYTDCRDRFFMIAVNLSFAGQKPYFEAVDETGVFPITEQYAAQCGYTAGILIVPGLVELRASYFSCHTTNQNDQIFTFNFNLIVTHNEERVSYALNKTCSPSLPWSPREVTCEVNYLEVSVKSDVFCPLAPKPDIWNSSMQTVYGSATPGWQVVLVKEGKGMKPLTLSEARLNGYTFTVTENRLVARAAYGQPHSSRSEIDGISLEVLHAIMFSRQEWHVLLVDLVAPCTMYEAPYDGSGYMTWETPFTLYTGLHTTNFSFGLDGKLWEPHVAQDMGYSVTSDGTVKVGVPYDADGAYRKSVVTDDLFDLYTCHFYMEQMATSDGGAETRTRTFRTLSSLIRRLLLTENWTVPHEEMFTVYLGNVPGDLELVAIQLNEEKFEAPFVNSSSYALDFTVMPNHTYGYTLTVPFADPLVIKRFSAEHGAEVNELNIVYSVMIKPKRGPFSYHTTVTVLKGFPPPQFNASCSESGITFKLDHEPSNVLWEFTVGSEPLTPELAAQQGYILSNNNQTLQLEVPLFTHGYQYENITLNDFLGTFETRVRNRQTSEVLSSSVKTCPFTAKEMIGKKKVHFCCMVA
uniref:Zona pellucida protein AX 4 n=1 Tax=Neogobius melanostomus TaxID=47308 RepID=A0A8C6UQW7_9GOBI